MNEFKENEIAGFLNKHYRWQISRNVPEGYHVIELIPSNTIMAEVKLVQQAAEQGHTKIVVLYKTQRVLIHDVDHYLNGVAEALL